MIESMTHAAQGYLDAGYSLPDAIDMAIANVIVSNKYPGYIYSRIAARLNA